PLLDDHYVLIMLIYHNQLLTQRYDLMNSWMEKRNEGRWVAGFLNDNNIGAVGVYGLGTIGERVLEELLEKGVNVPCIIESRPELLGGRYAGIPVINNYMLRTFKMVKCIIVTPFHALDSIRETIHEVEPGMKIIGIDEIINRL
ncbi:MAG: hypothetical protein GY765_16770, partial [bacterium]|nr:hypothetical protein [bacterium]